MRARDILESPVTPANGCNRPFNGLIKTCRNCHAIITDLRAMVTSLVKANSSGRRNEL
jgi:hypothetical protein